MNNIMTVKDLCLWYGQTQALKNINIDIPQKSITALIGPSGCGKSTFLKTLNRMNDLVQDVKITGEVKYGDMDIFAPDTDVNKLRKDIGMVFQKPNPFPMSIYDNIAYGPRTHGIKNKARLDEIVENSLRGAAIWDEGLKSRHLVCQAVSSRGFVSPELLPLNRRYFLWMSLQVRLTLYLHQR